MRREVIGPILTEYSRAHRQADGDAASAEFGSVVEAVACTVAMQRSVAERQAAIPPERRIMFRMGVSATS